MAKVADSGFMDKRWLYRLWRRVPFRLQWAILWRSNAKFLVGVLGLIVDGQGRVLLLRHDYRRAGEGQWSLPGGTLHGHEDAEQGLARELREELGQEAAVGEILAALRDEDLPRLDLYFRCTLAGERLVLSDEIAEAGYFRLDDLPADMFPEQVALIKQELGSVSS